MLEQPDPLDSLEEDQPYPGLRSFRPEETDIFFGREVQVAEMVDLLGRSRFLAVTGTSGSGKSSLVRTGLRDALSRGVLAQAGARWIVADFRPGLQPRHALAAALLDATGRPREPHDNDLLQAALSRGPLSLVEWFRELSVPPDTNLLLLVDQFEELFRFGREGITDAAIRDEMDGFVRLLLASAASAEGRIYVVLTMRSDFLGECAEFPGLAEAISRSQFLTPRLNRDQLRQAIEGPAAVYGGRVEPALVARLLNDMGTNPDQLPLMQHAMMRLWSAAGGHSADTDDEVVLTLKAYLDLGGINGIDDRPGALSGHADAVLRSLNAPGQQALAERLFRALAQGEGSGGRDVRRPVQLGEVAAAAGVEWTALVPIVEAFRAPGVNLLMPARPQELARDTVIDISHESLIRQWRAMRGWTAAEATSSQIYTGLEKSAKAWQEKRQGLLGPIELANALAWQRQEKPTAAWAHRYGDAFELAMTYLRRSRVAQVRRRFALGLSVVVFFAAISVGGYIRQEQRRENLLAEQQRTATKQQSDALLAADKDYQDTLVSSRFWFAAHSALKLLGEGKLELARLVVLDAIDGVHRPASGVLAPVPGAIAIAQGNSVALAASASTHGRGAVDPKGRFVAVAAKHDVKLWEATTGAPLRVLRGLRQDVTAVAISPDGELIAAGTSGGEVAVWFAETGARKASAPTTGGGSIKSIAFGIKGDELLFGRSDQKLPLRWALNDTPPAPLHSLCTTSQLPQIEVATIRLASPGPSDSVQGEAAIAAGPDGQVVAIDGNGVVTVWRGRDACPDQSEIHDWDSRTSAVSIAVDWNSQIAIFSAGGDFDNPSGASFFSGRISPHPHFAPLKIANDEYWLSPSEVQGATWVTTGAQTGQFLIGTNGAIRAVRLQSSRTTATPEPTAIKPTDTTTDDVPAFEAIGTIRMRGFGSLLAGNPMGVVTGDQTRLMFQRVPSTPQSMTLAQTPGNITLSPDGSLVASVDAKNQHIVTVRAMNGVGVERTLEAPDNVNALSIGNNNKLLVVELGDGRLFAASLDADNPSLARLTCSSPLPCNHGSSERMIAAADEPLVVSAYDKFALVWDGTARKAVLALAHGDQTVQDATVLPGNAGILTLAEDNRLRRWDVGDGRLHNTLEIESEPIQSTLVTALSRPIAVVISEDGSIDIFDFSTPDPRKLRFRLPGVSEAGLSADGKLLATRLNDGNAVALWQTQDASFYGYGTLPTGAMLGALKSDDQQPKGVILTRNQVTTIDPTGFVTVSPNDLETYTRASALRDMSLSEIADFARPDYPRPRPADPLANVLPCEANPATPDTDNRSCMRRLKANPLDSAGWRGLAPQFALQGDLRDLNLPTPTMVIAACLGDPESLIGLADWLEQHDDGTEAALIGRLREAAWREDSNRADDYVSWMMHAPDTARLQLLPERDQLAQAAARGDALSLFALGMLGDLDAQPGRLGGLLAAYTQAAEKAPRGSQLRGYALERAGSVARVLGPDQTILALNAPHATGQPTSGGSAVSVALPWTAPMPRDLDIRSPKSVEYLAESATDAMEAGLGMPHGLDPTRKGLRLAADLLPGVMEDAEARTDLSAQRPELEQAFYRTPTDKIAYHTLDAVLRRLIVLAKDPCDNTVIARWRANQKYRDNSNLSYEETRDASRLGDEAYRLVAACALSSAASAEVIETAVKAARDHPLDTNVTALADKLWSSGAQADAVDLTARRYVALENALDQTDPNFNTTIETYRSAERVLTGRLAAIEHLPDPAASFSGMGFGFQVPGNFLEKAKRRDEAIEIYDDAIKIRLWLADRLSDKVIQDDLPVWSQISYAYDWLPYDFSTPAGARETIQPALSELSAAEKQMVGKDLYVLRRRDFAVIQVASAEAANRLLSNGFESAELIQAVGTQLSRFGEALDTGGAESAWAADTYATAIMLLGGALIQEGGEPSTESERACDELAASPWDPERAPSTGVLIVTKVDAALQACRNALEAGAKSKPRIEFQLGRALSVKADSDADASSKQAGNDKLAAVQAYKQAIITGYPQALANTIFSAADYSDLPVWVPLARTYARTMLRKYGRVMAAQLLNGDHAPQLPAAGEAILTECIRWGDADAASQLAQLLAHGGPGVTADPEAALTIALLAQKLMINEWQESQASQREAIDAMIKQISGSLTSDQRMRAEQAETKFTLYPVPTNNTVDMVDTIITAVKAKIAESQAQR